MVVDPDKVFKKRCLLLLALPCSVVPWGGAWALCNGGVTVTSTLTVSANCNGSGSKPLSMDTGANVTVNSGVTVYNDAGSGRNGDGISVLSSATASSLVNNGTIATGQQIGVIVNGTLTSLLNAGMISSNVRRGLVLNGSTAVLGTLTNTGSIIGPFAGITNNSGGLLQTFNNRQGAGNVNGAVTYTGDLPTNYNIIINSPGTYGKLSSAGVTGSMTFGIYGTSSVAIGSYTGVLNGFTSSNLTGLTSGTYGGLNWTLNLASGSSSVWNLVFSAASTNMALGTSYALTDLGVSANRVFDGGTLALRSGDSSSGAFTLNAAGGRISAAAGGPSQLSGVISGVGGLTVDGMGLVALTGSNSYSGGTTVNSGTLSVGGDSALGTGSVFVASGGTLMGTGTINGALTVAGTLKPGNSPGYLAVNSTVTMNSGSTYQQDIAGTVQASAASPAGATGYYSFLNITGGQFVIQPNATLTPRLSGLFTASESGFGSTPYTPVLGDKFRIVTADGGIAGRFATLSQPAELSAGTQFIQFYNLAGSQSLDLAVIPSSYGASLAGLNGNGRAVASALDKIVLANQAGTASAQQDQLLYAASARNVSSLPSFTRALAGEVYGASLAVVPQATLHTQQAAIAHLGDAGGMPPDGAWGEVTYQRGQRSGDAHASGFASNLYQLVLGMDAYTAQGAKAGAGLALSNTHVTAEQATGRVQQGEVFVYAGLPLGASWMVDAMASYGEHSADHARDDVTGYTAGLGAKARGRDALVSAGLSQPVELEDMRVSLYARISWQQLHRASLDEGASAAALKVSSFDAQGLRALLGFTFGSLSADPMKAAQTYRFNAALGADTAKLRSPTLDASLAGVSTAMETPNTGAAFVQLGLSATKRFASHSFAYVRASAEARNGAILGSVNAGVQVQF